MFCSDLCKDCLISETHCSNLLAICGLPHGDLSPDGAWCKYCGWCFIRQIHLLRIVIRTVIPFILIAGWKGGDGLGRQKGKGREIV